MALSVAGKYAVITGAGSGINLAFAKQLLERGCSVLIGDLALRPEAEALLAHIAGHAVGLGSPLYFASKHGLHAFVRSLGSLREHLGIRVGAVAPGAVMTPMWLQDPDKRAILDADAGAADIFIHPDEIARGMMALCEDPAYGDGTILEVTKGSTRVVPLYHAEPPSGVGSMVPGYQKAADELVTYVKGGVKV
ncbi:Maltose permease MAL61 [Verticillium dahliae VDG2]|nr:Maltose permease MAL61 [Verticillium dahliae VDG2]